MNTLQPRLLLLVLALVVGVIPMRRAVAQTPCPLADAHASRCMVFTMERFGVMVPAYTLVLRDDGKVRYRPALDASLATFQAAPWRTVSTATTDTIFAAAEGIRSGVCANPGRPSGFGTKASLTLWSSDAQIVCNAATANDPKIASAVQAFQAMAAMIEGGEHLARDHRGDRLAIQRDLDELTDQTMAGKAIEPQLIAPALQSLAEDETLVAAIREKAAALLHGAPAASAR